MRNVEIGSQVELAVLGTVILAGVIAEELVKRVACAWAANLEYEAPADNALGGWHGDALELRYAPVGHGDGPSSPI